MTTTTDLTVTDLFAGAGGSSTGAASVPGITIRVAANHWRAAVEVHNANHPDADHVCADISQINPRYFPRTQLLWASPECTNHSGAKGVKRVDAQPDLFGEVLPEEAAERSRATMHDVVRFAEVHDYQAIVVENVVEVVKWLPFRGWLIQMEALGYDHQLVSLNSMHATAHGLPAPQSRDRVYIVFWKRGNRTPDLHRMQRPLAYCVTCDEVVEAMQAFKNPATKVGRYRSQYVYRCPKTTCRNEIVEPAWVPAATAIDWTLTGQRIGDRSRPLAAKTRARIAAGIARYWSPLLVEAAGNTYDAASPRHPAHGDPNGYYRAWSVGDPLRTLHTTASKALAVPVEGREGKAAAPVEMPLRTQTTRNETGIAFDPFIAELRGGGSVARSTRDPLATFTASGTHHGLVVPSGGTWNELATPTTEALRTLATREAYALLMRNNTGGAEMSTPITEVMRTLTT
ncbi:MAG: DNA cytosine methyltransferase, partial [Propionibacteriaceae bacterium]|nr:DNA cytosine methyltransferase [Propionibacteriaceae bacterium]